MKLMIASDIHGSSFWCKKMINKFNEINADKLLLLGDILYHGPRNDLPTEYNPKSVISMLNPLKNKILCVRGNCDSEVDQMVLDFPILAEYAWLNIDGINIFAAHGHNFNKFNPPKLNNSDMLINGHFHIPEISENDNFTYINCGSVSLPKNNTPHSFVLFENGYFSLNELL